LRFEETNCLICGGTDHSPFLTGYDRFDPEKKRKFSLVRCNRCNFIFLNPRPDSTSIQKFYSHQDYHPFLNLNAPSKDLISKIYLLIRPYSIRWKRKKIHRAKGIGSILDVGCGTGEFLFEMKRWKWEVVGIEADERGLQYARDTLGLKVFKDPEWNFPRESFDVVTFWHTLEHIHDLRGTLERIVPLLKREGLLLIAVPNISSLDFKIYKRDWVALDLPRHLYHFEPNSLKALCRSLGLEVFKYHQIPLDTFYNCLMSERLAFERSNRKTIFLFHVLRGAIVALMSLYAGILRKGSGILYYLRRL